MFLTAAAILLLWLLVQAPAMAATANPGGASAPGGSGAKKPASKTPAQKTTSKPAPASSAHVKTVRITSVQCIPVNSCATNPHEVSTHGILLIAGKGLAAGMVVAFPHSRGARISSASPASHLRKGSQGLEVTVPKSAHSGNIMVLLSHGRYSSSYGPISVVRYALHPPKPKDPPPAAAPVASAPSASAFNGQGMWIWYLSASDGGNLASIVAQAHAAGVTTLFVKSSDGSTNYWSQFSPELVAQLHANGLHVCAWQFVYGTNPAGEASLGAKAVADGADCLVIDAEAEYEGRYGAAQTYIADLRAKIGPNYPLGLASFPYVYDHTSFPYSVFLGPNGAQFNAPQMYWHDIGNSIDTIYANTYIANRIYGRPIFPARADLREPLQHRTRALPRGGCRLRRSRAVLVGLAGNPGERVGRAGGTAGSAEQRHAKPRLHRTDRRQPRRSGTVDAGAPRRRHLHAADDRHIRSRDDRQPRAVPVSPWHRPHGQDRSGDLAGAAGAAPRRGQLDGGRAKRGLSLGRIRRAESACRSRVRRRSTSSRTRSPCRSARARAAAL